MGMTYGNPSIDHALQKLQSAGVRRLVVLPLYPQYSATTTAAAFDRVDAALARWRAPPERLLIEDYHAEPDHVAALAASIAAARAPFDHLLFSFHGIPRRYAAAGDPYGDAVPGNRPARRRAARAARRSAGRSRSSRASGGARWLEPYTEDRLRELARAGVKRIAVACPGFAVDCLETLEEIAIRGAATFIAAGGVDFEYIPALNDSAAQVDCLARLVTGATAVIGRFHEVSVHAPDVLESLAFYERLGFTQVTAGEAFPYPYAVVADGRLAIGLHGRELAQSPLLSFVLPDLLEPHQSDRARGHRNHRPAPRR